MEQRFDLVDVTRDAGVSVVAMNRPDKRNALSLQLLDELAQALEQEERAAEVSAVVLTGHGDVFSAGADRSPVAGLEGDALARAFAPIAVEMADGVARLMLRLLTMRKPVVGAINGHAVGGALIVALGCDLRVASRDALFWMPEIGMGRAIGEPSLQTLLACVGPLVTKDIVLSGRRFTASELAALHMVNVVVAADEVAGTALAWARALAGRDASAVATVKVRSNVELARIWQALA